MRAIDDTGNRFGKLLVIEQLGNKLKRYRCLCDCGNFHEVLASHLRAGRATHCGCVTKRGSKYRPWKGCGDISADFWYNRVVRSANGVKNNRRIKKLEVTVEQAWELFLKQDRRCALSGIELKFPTKQRDRNFTASLDRIDSNGDYTIDNVQWVHKHINIMKNCYPCDYFVQMCKKVGEYKGKQ